MEFLHMLENIRTQFGDLFFSVLTFLGGEAAVIVLFAVNFWCIDKNLAYDIGFSFFSSATVIQNIKITARIERPFVRDTTLKPVEAALGGATGYSFPSGHTQTSASVFIPCAVRLRKRWWLSAICVLMIVLTGFSRLYLGVHTPEDVLCGFLSAAVCAAVIIFLRAKFGDKWITPAAYVLIAGAAGSIIYGVILNTSNVITTEFLADTVKNAAACLGFAAGTILERRFANFDPTGTKFKQGLVRFLIGAAVGLLLMYGPKLLYSGILVFDGLRYFAAIFWLVFIYPLILSKMKNKKST